MRKSMSDTFDHYGQAMDQMSDGFVEYGDEKPIANKTCKFCHETGLHWQMHLNNWRLFNPNGDLHNCLDYE